MTNLINKLMIFKNQSHLDCIDLFHLEKVVFIASANASFEATNRVLVRSREGLGLPLCREAVCTCPVLETGGHRLAQGSWFPTNADTALVPWCQGLTSLPSR